MQEQLAKLAKRERETAAVTGLDELTPTVIMERGKAHEQKEKAKQLVRDADWVNIKSALSFSSWTTRFKGRLPGKFPPNFPKLF